ncbi:hypothetical protein BH11PLA2_BH11PLA2_25300 [soil metagenome]
MRTCSQIQDDLLAAASPVAVAHSDVDVTSHLYQCVACRELLSKLQALESMVKAVPTPATAAVSQRAFLDSLPCTVPAVPHRRRHVAALAWATAAAVFVAVGVAAFMLTPVNTVQAKSQVLDTLVEWNLKLSEAESSEERNQLHQGQRPQLHHAVRTAKLSPRERQLADQLLSHADWLTRNDDSLDAAERFQDIAEAVLDILDESPEHSPQAEHYAVYYSKLMDRGVEANLEHAAKKPHPIDTKRQAKLQRMVRQQQRHEAKLKAMSTKLSDAAREKAQPKKKPKQPK